MINLLKYLKKKYNFILLYTKLNKNIYFIIHKIFC